MTVPTYQLFKGAEEDEEDSQTSEYLGPSSTAKIKIPVINTDCEQQNLDARRPICA